MKYDFDQIISRKETYSTKWLKFSDDDVIPMWIADMDFICPPEITSAMSERIAQGIFGYSEIPSNLTEVFVNNVKNNSGWSIEKDWVVWIPGGVVGLNVTCKTVLAPENSLWCLLQFMLLLQKHPKIWKGDLSKHIYLILKEGLNLIWML